MQNKYYYKQKLQSALNKYIEDLTKDDNQLGYIPNEMVENMTEAAWLILKQNYDINEYMKNENIITT